MARPHSRLRDIGRALQDEESRFIGYPEIERKSKDLGFGMTVRTIRFYVDEGILPPPRKVGKTPVYEEEWILNVLLAIHLMKTRLNRSLTEIRKILGQLQESPEALADKLSVLYEDYAKSGFLKPMERAGLMDAFFDLLTGRLGHTVQASHIKLSELVDAVASAGHWEGDEWVPPEGSVILASQGLVGEGGQPPRPPIPKTAKVAMGPPAVPAPSAGPPSELPTPTTEPPPARQTAPAGAVTCREARAGESSFVQRFKGNFERLGRVHCPSDGKGYKAGPRERTFVKRDRSSELVELMKRHRIYDRALLEELPLGERWEFQVHQRGLFGRGDLKVVVTAIAVSPLDTMVAQRWASEPQGPLAAKRALNELELVEGVFSYVGLLSTVGWSPAAVESIPVRRGVLCCLIEATAAGAWKVHLVPDERWGGVERVFDPESDQEKVERAYAYMQEHLKPKGEFLIIRNLPEDLDVAPSVVQTAIDELLAQDDELSVTKAGGREIIKRSRL